MVQRRSPSRARIARRQHGAPALLEQLEARSLLANSAFPLISDLTNPNNSVVRLQTNFGDIDFELFDTAAPITVNNFLKYVRDGDFDRTFFHRYALDQQAQPFVLQGGLARLSNPTNTGSFISTVETIPTDAPITNEFNQSNLVRTIAMARIGGQVNSATSQFFINLANNSFLDTVDQGFTVFGRVATNASWAVVQNIISNISQDDQPSPYGELPVRAGTGYTGNNVSDDQLVTIRDAEIIKPQGVASFYNFRYYYPEGFAGGTINEFLPLGNPGSSTVRYQIVVRSETRDPKPSGNVDFWYRDKVINTGSIAGNRRAGVTISQFQNAASNLVPSQGKPYAIEVWATGPLAATFSHYDFGSSTIESFQPRPTDLTTWQKWTFPDVLKGPGVQTFPVWQNLSDVSANITARFISIDGTVQTLNFTTEAFRRGGLSLQATPAIADGRYSLEITADRPIIAALTQYDTTTTLSRGGSTQIGITGDGARRAVLPQATVLTSTSGSTTTVDATAEISIYNPGSVTAITTLIFSFTDPMQNDITYTLSGNLIAGPGQRRTFDVSSDVNLRDQLAGKTFSVRYNVSSATSIFANVKQLRRFNATNTDFDLSPFAYTAATSHLFAEGFMNGARANNDLFETISLYNPNSADFSAPAVQASVTVRFLFNDGFVLAQDYTVDAGRRLDLPLTTNAGLLAQNASNRFFYSIEVVSDVPILASMSHYDLSLGGVQPSGGDIFLGTQRGTVVALSALGS
jgi:cyclophilin family peptidyl-prolyl cis-trans isomerase